MRITLDGKTLDTTVDHQATLSDLIDQIREPHLGGRIVVSVALDGGPLIGEALTEQLERPLNGTLQVDLESANPFEVGANALRECQDQLGDARETLSAIARQVQAGQPDKSLSELHKFLNVWRISQQALTECSKLLNRDLTLEEANGTPIRQHIEVLSNKLRELRDAFEARDMVLLTDLIEYEMPELCETWQGVFEALATLVRADAQPIHAGQ